MADDAKQRITGFGTIDVYVGKENEIVIKQENYHDDRLRVLPPRDRR